MIRSVRPTDLLALVRLNRRGYVNEACTWTNLGRTNLEAFGLPTFFDHWLSIDENRHTWIGVEHHRIEGLISARHRAGQTVWEVDRLVFPSDSLDDSVCLHLLDYVSAVGGEVGVQRVFLRLTGDSSLFGPARQAGFFPYCSEQFYVRETSTSEPFPIPSGFRLRRRSGVDNQGLFQLYSASVPGEVRRARAMTLQEWKDALEHCGARGARREFVVEVDGRLQGYLEIARHREDGYFDLMVHPDASDLTKFLVQAALHYLRGSSSMRCLVPDYAGWHHLLAEQGFGQVTACHALVKQLAVRVKQQALVPARA